MASHEKHLVIYLEQCGSWLCEVVIPGLEWSLGDGKTVPFWKDKWLGNFTLLELAPARVPETLQEMRARDLLSNDSGWNLRRLMSHVPEFIILRLRAIVLDTVTGDVDRLLWGENLDGKFSVKSAYSMLTSETVPKADVGKLYDRVWRVIGPERVRCFLWLVANQAIMTNVERFRRILSDNGVCSV